MSESENALTETTAELLKTAESMALSFNTAPGVGVSITGALTVRQDREAKREAKRDVWLDEPGGVKEKQIPVEVFISCENRERKGVMVYPVLREQDCKVEIDLPNGVWRACTEQAKPGDKVGFILALAIEKNGLPASARYDEMYLELSKAPRVRKKAAPAVVAGGEAGPHAQAPDAGAGAGETRGRKPQHKRLPFLVCTAIGKPNSATLFCPLDFMTEEQIAAQEPATDTAAAD